MKSNILKAKIRMIEMGIVPAITGRDLSSMLRSLSKEERAIAKRKFRKKWRKLAKNNKDIYLMTNSICDMPDRNKKRNRCVFVTRSIIKETSLLQ